VPGEIADGDPAFQINWKQLETGGFYEEQIFCVRSARHCAARGDGGEHAFTGGKPKAKGIQRFHECLQPANDYRAL
jgi:hypothetical protein